MIQGKKIVVVMPAYNAELTIRQTIAEIPFHLVDAIVVVDDASDDATPAVAEQLPVSLVIRHHRNMGYGRNQKTCYDAALSMGADIVIMLHPDYQYTPKLIPAMVEIIASGLYPVVIGSRILGKGALKGGMPVYKYIANRILTLAQNILMNQKLSEYHTGYRAYSAEVLRNINYHENADGFVFDNQVMAQIFYAGYEIAEISCPTRYFKEASSINFTRSMGYGTGVLLTAFQYFLQKTGIASFRIFRGCMTK